MGWPADVVDGFGGGVEVDLGAGTGKLTRLLVGRFERVVAVEPSEDMGRIGATVVPKAE